MNPTLGQTLVTQGKYYGFRIILCGLALFLYVQIVRPARIVLTEYLVLPQVTLLDSQEKSFNSVWESNSLHIEYTFMEADKKLQYRPKFGFFFLLTLMALMFVTTNWKPYALLVGLHGMASILAYLFLVVGATGFSAGFIITDAINAYLAPALSLAIVPLTVVGLLE